MTDDNLPSDAHVIDATDEPIFNYSDDHANNDLLHGPAFNSIGQYLFQPVGMMLQSNGIPPGPAELANCALSLLNHILDADCPPKERREILQRMKKDILAANKKFGNGGLILPATMQ